MTDTRKQEAFHAEIIASITAEDRLFDMAYWVRNPDGSFVQDEYAPATCETASCLAGHIEALRPDLVAALLPDVAFSDGTFDHDLLAAAVYKAETGVACPLDFWGRRTDIYLGDLTRDDAVAHVLGQHPEWPRLDQAFADEDDYQP